MADSNVIPSLYAAGSFTALPPFDKVVDPSVYYTVEQISTVRELQSKNADLYALMFQPIGVTEADYPGLLTTASNNNFAVVVLTSKNNPDVYILTNYIKSFPLIDGVAYENICIVAQLGAVPPGLKDVCNTTVEHFRKFITANLGIANPIVFIGSSPTRGYVSKEDADTFESTRLQAIGSGYNDVSALNQANDQITRMQAYIDVLEGKVKALIPSTTPTPTDPSATDNSGADTK